jgi:hypothetical protein
MFLWTGRWLLVGNIDMDMSHVPVVLVAELQELCVGH